MCSFGRSGNMADILLFDFKDYIDNYSGRDRLLRIHHMVKRGLLEEEDELIGLEMAFKELKYGTPTWRLATDYEFLEIVSTLINGRLGPDYTATSEILNDMKSLYNEELYKLIYPLRHATVHPYITSYIHFSYFEYIWFGVLVVIKLTFVF